ncbi:hypothetical protein DBZ36_07390 [Alginatibacterium sediminis]|uniref:Zinc finger DksA/TraR C4-type domain-containing protein n=1 Tax=Alginatibacterium sediminis TaxID=2164068 RepID=A0A420EHX1_9ALTE|nr:TraR/DksA C4-type zinc finger protein [Alginatibacterium sediminis]RKF20257.1 hypothetical protein DBZ36_07390 [Alginatibacterium sediminis]
MSHTEVRSRLLGLLASQKAEIIVEFSHSSRPSLQLSAERLHQMSHSELIELAEKIDDQRLHANLKQLQRIDAALCQLDIGMYGLCSDCEEPIESKALELDPCVQRCRSCQDKHANIRRKHIHAL